MAPISVDSACASFWLDIRTLRAGSPAQLHGPAPPPGNGTNDGAYRILCYKFLCRFLSSSVDIWKIFFFKSGLDTLTDRMTGHRTIMVH